MKNKILVLLVAFSLLLCGCGFSNEKSTESTIIINKDGTIKSIVVEEFPQDKYDENELRQMIRDNVWAYNNSHDTGDVKLVSCEVVNNVATLTMLYNSSSDYAEFNDKDFYFGTVSAARDAGYAKSATLKNAHGVNTVSGSAIDDLATYHMVVFDEDVLVKTYASVLYYSQNLNLVDDVTVTREDDASGLSYIIVK